MHESSKVVLATSMAFLCTGISVNAFQFPVRSATKTAITTRTINRYGQEYTHAFMSNGDDSSSEQALADADAAIITDTNNIAGESPSKFSSLLEETGLTDLKCIQDLPPKRTISCNDVFCNRELSLGNVRAIGFDMDYTIAQYKQPAFDKLAFDGAKEKLVKKFGYPKELLDVEYDHTVRQSLHLDIILLSFSTARTAAGH
jgi:hypothetical protein